MKTFENISNHQTITFGKAEKSYFWRFQNTDYQYLHFYSFSSSFTGKEKDPETGYSYFGARYLDNELMTCWLSVDPLADKYPSISPYAYCAWNPVKLVDPEGEEIDDYFSHEGKYLGSDDAKTNNVRIISEMKWNTLQKNEYGKIDHDVGCYVSVAFSIASRQGMDKEAQLLVYNHYSPTGYKLEDLDNGGDSWGMRTHFEYGKEPVILIRLDGNSKVSVATCDYADEIRNLFVHEKNHIELYETIGHLKYQEINTNELEQRAVKAQMNDDTWGKTRAFFQDTWTLYGIKYGLQLEKP